MASWSDTIGIGGTHGFLLSCGFETNTVSFTGVELVVCLHPSDCLEDVTQCRIDVNSEEHDESQVYEIRQQEVHEVVGSHHCDAHH